MKSLRLVSGHDNKAEIIMRSGLNFFLSYTAVTALALATAGTASALGVSSIAGSLPTSAAGIAGPSVPGLGVHGLDSTLPDASSGHVRVPHTIALPATPSLPSSVKGHNVPSGGGSIPGSIDGHRLPSVVVPAGVAGHTLPSAKGPSLPGLALPSTPSGPSSVAGHQVPSSSGGSHGVPYSVAKHLPEVLPYTHALNELTPPPD
jgi:hypothetical protein